MPSKTRVLLAASCLAVLVLSLARCGGSSTPTSPTSSTSAVVAGTVNRASGGAAAGLTVSVVGASASAAVQSSGAFELSGVPAGQRSAPLQGRHRRRHSAAAERYGGGAHPDPGQRQRQHRDDRHRGAIDDGEGGAVPCRGQRFVSPDRRQRQRRVRASCAWRREGRRARTRGSSKDLQPGLQADRCERREHQDQEVDERPGCRRGPGADDHGWRRGQLGVRRHQHGERRAHGSGGDRRSRRAGNMCRRRYSRGRSVDDLHRLGHGDGWAVRQCRNGRGRLVRRPGHVNRQQPLLRTSCSK